MKTRSHGLTNPDHESLLASLSEFNHSLREQVVDLLLSIAILKETQQAQPNPQEMGEAAARQASRGQGPRHL
jgi:hypothetical protein